MTRKQAVKKLSETRILSTDLLKPLGLNFDTWLQFAQLSDARCKKIIGKMIVHFS